MLADKYTHIVEGFADHTLVEILGIPRKKIHPAGGKPEINGRLRNEPKSPFIAMVDEDPGAGQPSYLKDFQLVSSYEYEAIELKRKGNQWLIVLKPDLEGWLIRTAEICKVDMKKLPSSRDELHAVLALSRRPTGFIPFIEELVRKQCKGVMLLQRLLQGKFKDIK